MALESCIEDTSHLTTRQYHDLRFKSTDKIDIEKFVQTEKWYHFPANHNSVVYPNPDSRYIYVEYVV